MIRIFTEKQLSKEKEDAIMEDRKTRQLLDDLDQIRSDIYQLKGEVYRLKRQLTGDTGETDEPEE